ncbi:putative major sperm protein (MSP) [Helianthus annuus]|nr:putative major sperm protein (MSP) [Helianthus annuus]
MLKFKNTVLLLSLNAYLSVIHMHDLPFICLMLIPTVELGKPSHCDLKVSNTTDKNIAFKVKTTSPKKYFVRPNTGIIPPWDTCIIRVTLQAQLEYPPDMQCRDKFLLQSTPVPPNSDTDALPANTFSKEAGKVLEEYKLKVVYVARTDKGNSDNNIKQNSDPSSVSELITILFTLLMFFL